MSKLTYNNRLDNLYFGDPHLLYFFTLITLICCREGELLALKIQMLPLKIQN